MSDKATLIRLLREINDTKRTEDVTIAKNSIIKLFDSVRDELYERAEKAEAERDALRARVVELEAALKAADEDAERLAGFDTNWSEWAAAYECNFCGSYSPDVDKIKHDDDCALMLHRARVNGKLEGGESVMDSPDKEAKG